MGTVTVSLPADGSTGTVSQYNTPLTTVVNEFNGNIDNANIKSGAAIATSKLADDSGITAAKVATGMAVQLVNANFSAMATGTTLIPLDDTFPQNTEGDQYMTVTITPKSATNTLVIRSVVWLSNSGANATIITALFQDTNANAIATGIEFEATGTAMHGIPMFHTMVAGTTSAITFKVRAGSNVAGTTTFNGGGGVRYFSTSTKSYLEVVEYKS